MKTSESITNIAAALLAAQQEMPHPKKTAQNPHLRNRFADLPGVIDTVKESLNKHGIVVVQSVGGSCGYSNESAAQPQDVAVTTRLIHAESGEWVEDEIGQGVSDQKGLNISQSIGSAITYLRRYSISAMAFVASEPDDDGNEVKGGDVKAASPSADFDL